MRFCRPTTGTGGGSVCGVGSSLSPIEAVTECPSAGGCGDVHGDGQRRAGRGVADCRLHRLARVGVASAGSSLTLAGVAAGTATITVTAEDTDGNRVSDAFMVSVASAPQPEPASDPQPSDIVARYDANGNGAIERSEFQQAKRDYADGLIEYAEVLAEPEPAGRGRRGAP